MPKPDVLLYDDVMKWTALRPKDASLYPIPNHAPLIEKQLRDYRVAIRQSQRFWLTDEFSEASMATSRDIPKLIQWSSLARLPYGRTWFEFDCKAKVAASQRAGTLAHPKASLADVPNRMAFLLETLDDQTGVWSMTTFSDALGEPGKIGCHPVMYLFAPEGPSPLMANSVFMSQPISDRETLQKMAYFGLGIHGDLTSEIRRAFDGRLLCSSANFWNAVLNTQRSHGDAKQYASFFAPFYNQAIREEAGMLRWVVAILAMMAAAPIEKHYFPASGEHRIYRGKNLPYLDHNVITLKLPKVNAVPIIHRALLKTVRERHKNRRHAVRGHWRVKEYGRPLPYPCRHEPTLIENGIGVCLKCERKIRWQPDFERGDASVGYVVHDYVVEADKKRKMKV